MKRRLFITAATLCALLPVRSLIAEEEAPPEPLSLEAISDYIQGLTYAQSSFTQVNDDNTISTGMLWLRRPGWLRLEYDAPDSGLIMVFGGQLAIFDKKSNEPPEAYPARRTPLWLLLRRNVRLADQEMVIGHGHDGAYTYVDSMDPELPEYGWIRMRFSHDPIQLSNWTIYDAHGGETFMSLDQLELGQDVPNKFFDINLMRKEFEEKG